MENLYIKGNTLGTRKIMVNNVQIIIFEGLTLRMILGEIRRVVIYSLETNHWWGKEWGILEKCCFRQEERKLAEAVTSASEIIEDMIWAENEEGLGGILKGWKLGLPKKGRDWCRDVVRIEVWNQHWQRIYSWHERWMKEYVRWKEGKLSHSPPFQTVTAEGNWANSRA